MSMGLLNNVYANDDQAATSYSAQAYNPKDFCNGPEGAEKLMEDLEKENAKKFNLIKIYKEEIDELVESDKLVNSIRQLKEQYLESLEKIAKLKGNTDTSKALNDFIVVAQSASTLDGVRSRSPDFPKRNMSRPYIQKIQALVNSFSNKIKQKTQDRMNKAVDEIPNDIAPSQTTNLIQTVTPTMNSLIEKNVTTENLTTCFSSTATEDSCKSLGINLSQRAGFITTINKERDALSLQLSNKPSFNIVTPVQGQNVLTVDEQKSRVKYDAVVKAQGQIQDFTSILNTFEMPDKTRDNSELPNNVTQTSTNYSDKVIDQIARNESNLKGVELLFYHFSIDLQETLATTDVDMNTEEGALEAIDLQRKYQEQAVKDATELQTTCDFLTKDISEVSKEKINSCYELTGKISEKFDIFNETHVYRISDLNTKIKKLTNEDNFGDIETMKKYVAEKYMCSCNKDKKSLNINRNQESLVLNGESCSNQFLTVSKIEGLSDSSSFIAKALYANEIKLPMDNQSCEKSPGELSTTAKTCESNSFIKNKFPELCNQVRKEYTVKTQNNEIETNRNAKLEKIHSENYVEYDSSSPTGHKVIKKKSKWQIAGEGVLPVLPNALPMWLGNFQMKNNIKMLTNQALFQKQYLHNLGFYNQAPWAFSNSYMGYGNPFMPGFSSQPGSSTQLGGSSGFNFGM